MGRMFLLFSHTLTDEQKNDAKANLDVETFVSLPKELQERWSNVPADMESLKNYLEPIINFLNKKLSKEDIILIQGDFGATCLMVKVVKQLGFKAVYATTVRKVIEIEQTNGEVVKKSVFKHGRFREYE